MYNVADYIAKANIPLPTDMKNIEMALQFRMDSLTVQQMLDVLQDTGQDQAYKKAERMLDEILVNILLYHSLITMITVDMLDQVYSHLLHN